MRIVIGFLMVLAGLVFGVWMGLWVCFIGGIVQVVNEIKSPEGLNALNFAIGIARVVFASVVGYLSAILVVFPGFAMMSSGYLRGRNRRRR